MSKPKKIMWVSRHDPLVSQLKELDRLFPNHVLIVDPRPFSGAADIIKRFREESADEMVVVAPWTVLRAIVCEGVTPIWAEMEQTTADLAETASTGQRRRYYRFVKFHHCLGVELKLEPINPPSEEASQENNDGKKG